MLKIFIGFVIFAALAIFVIMKGGDSLDMGGEKHGADAVHAPAEAASAAPASAPAADASAAK
jgi:hypothetical protein